MMKKSLYRCLLATSLLGAVTATLALHHTHVQASEKGTFTVGDAVLNVRRSPSTSGEKVASYQPGDKINYDDIVVSEGYRWISYVGSSGHRNYVAIGTADGSASYGSLSGDVSKTSISTGQDFDFTSIAGTWVNGKGEVMTIDANGRFNGNWSLSVEKIEDGKVGFYKDIDGGGVGTKTYGELLYAGHTTNALSTTGDLSDKSRDRIFFSQYPGAEANEFYYRQDEKTGQNEEKSADKTASTNQPTEAEQSLIAKVWNQLGANQYAYRVYRRPAGTPVNYYDGVGENYPEVTYLLAEDVAKTGNPNAASTEVLFSDNGDGTIKLYQYIKKWHFPRDQFEEATKKHLADTQTINLEEISAEEQERLLGLVTSYEGFDGQDDTAQTDQKADKTATSPQESGGASSFASDTATDQASATETGSEETAVSPATQEGNALQKIYQTLTGKKKLPSTGEAVSVLGLLGAGLLAAAYFVKNKLTEKKEK